MAAGKSQSLWTPTFALLCCAQFFGSAQHALLQPTFPLFITALGGTPFKVGLVIACFAVTSVVFRPLIGGWADKWSETRVLICGQLLLSAAVFFCFIPFAEATMFANALRGLGWAGLSAAGYSLLALSAPAERRGEASGYYSGIQASGTILLPAVALWLIDAPFGGFRHGFCRCHCVGGHRRGHRCAPRAPRPATDSQPACGLLCSVVAGNFKRFGPGNYPGIRAFIWIPCHFPGSGEFFGSLREGNRHREHRLVLCRLRGDKPLARPMLGKVSDRIGRRRALLACFMFQAVALLALAFAANLIGLIIPGMLYMVGLAMASATTLAIAMEQAKPERRGRAMATFSVALPLSNGVGALICGSLVESFGYFWMYLVAACIAVGGLVVTIANRGHLK